MLMNLNDVPVLVEIYMEEHGLLAKGWSFKWSRGHSTFGRCQGWRKVIKISKPLAEVNTEEGVEKLILHEIAHALTPKDAGHGAEWKAKCIELGLVNEQRCWSTADTVQPPLRWTLTCPQCGYAWHRNTLPRHPRTKATRRYACPLPKHQYPVTLVKWRTADGPPRSLTEAIALHRHCETRAAYRRRVAAVALRNRKEDA